MGASGQAGEAPEGVPPESLFAWEYRLRRGMFRCKQNGILCQVILIETASGESYNKPMHMGKKLLNV